MGNLFYEYEHSIYDFKSINVTPMQINMCSAAFFENRSQGYGYVFYSVQNFPLGCDCEFMKFFFCCRADNIVRTSYLLSRKAQEWYIILVLITATKF